MGRPPTIGLIFVRSAAIRCDVAIEPTPHRRGRAQRAAPRPRGGRQGAADHQTAGPAAATGRHADDYFS